jgi:hypothetical protein
MRHSVHTSIVWRDRPPHMQRRCARVSRFRPVEVGSCWVRGRRTRVPGEEFGVPPPPRHCEEQSDQAINLAAQRKTGCFASLAMTADRFTLAFPRREAPEVLHFVCPRNQRGRGEDRVRAAPAVSQACCKRICCPRAYRFSGEHTGLPHAMALRLIRDRPGDPAFRDTIALGQR